MITPQELRKKTERKYFNVLQDLLQNTPFEKLIIRSDKSYTKSSLSAFEKEIQQLCKHSKESQGFGYSIDFQQVKTKYLGIQDLPISIYFETAKDVLQFLSKEEEYNKLKENIQHIGAHFPELEHWLLEAKNIKKIIEHQEIWEDLLKVCSYFKNNPKPNLYVRELPIKVHTKFIEQHQGILKELLNILIEGHIQKEEKRFEKRFSLKYAEPVIRFKLLDQGIADAFFSGINDLSIPLSQFEKLDLPIQRVIIVENKTSLYTALTLPNMKGTMAVFGGGFGVVDLKHVPWFRQHTLLYWGDIDVHGFEILSQFREIFSHTQSMLMDQTTFDLFFENDQGKPSKSKLTLYLNEEENMLYHRLKEKNMRLEQEKIPLDYVLEYFAN